MSSSSQIRRMWAVAISMSLVLGIIVLRLFVFQIVHGEEWKEVVIEDVPVTDRPERGVIYDRNGAILAVDRWDYRVAVSPSILTDPEELAVSLAPILQIGPNTLLDAMEEPFMYVVLAPRVTSEVADAIRELEYADEIQLDPLPRRDRRVEFILRAVEEVDAALRAMGGALIVRQALDHHAQAGPGDRKLALLGGDPAGFGEQTAAIMFPDDQGACLLYTSPSPRDGLLSRMPSSA